MSERRDAVLREMGLAPLWRLRGVATEPEPGDDPVAVESAVAATREQSPAPASGVRVMAAGHSPAGPRGPGPQESPAATADLATIVMPRERAGSTPVASARPVTDPARAARIAGLDWDALEADIRDCRECRLCEKRKQAVPGVGDRKADWMLVGEGPGSEEDQRGEPFVGAAGKLLDAMLGAIGLARGEGVYIANAVKCRPPHNRTPQADEIAICHPYLARQIELVRPRLLVALGRPAAFALLNTEIAIGASRGRVFHCGDTPVIVTYHPAYLLRNQGDKAKAWEDLCFARRVMRDAGGQV